MRKIIIPIILVLMAGLVIGCSEANSSNSAKNNSNKAAGLSDFEMKHGIGPVKEEIQLGQVDQKMAEKGKIVFQSKCSACHKIGERYVGPDLNNILDHRSPAYVMNMILNPAEMTKKHPEGKKMLAEFMLPMPYQDVTREETRAILEYFRVASSASGAPSK